MGVIANNIKDRVNRCTTNSQRLREKKWLGVHLSIRENEEVKISSYKIFAVIVFFTTVSSCARQYYIQPTIDVVATVSFSNLTDEIPVIYIVSDGKSSPINNYLIENKRPQDKSKYKTKIIANEIITIKYEYRFVMSKKTQISTTYSQFNIPTSVRKQSYKTASTCSNEVTFTPEKNKHYEVYFGMDNDKCIIKASEARTTSVSKKQLYSIPSHKL